MTKRYVIIGNFIYKRSFDATLLRCLNETEANKAMKQVHDNINGSHFNGKDIYHKLLRQGYYFPFMEKYCILHS